MLTIRATQEFQIVYSFGKRCRSTSVIAFVKPNDKCEARFGFTVSRKVSKSAVQRNRVKRILREAVRITESLDESWNKVGFDLVLNANKSALRMKSWQMAEELQVLLQKCYVESSGYGIPAHLVNKSNCSGSETL